MRCLVLLPAAALLACMSPVEADALRYDDEDGLAPDIRILAIPDGVASPARAEVAAPEPASATGDAPRYRMGGDGTVDDCFSVDADGFPAIDRTGGLVAVSHEQWLQLTPLQGLTTLRIISLADDGLADERMTIVPEGADTMDERVCPSLRAQVRKDVRRANDDLAARGFRSMDVLAVEYGDAEFAASGDLETPARERPLEVIVQHGEAIVRIPGVKVYERHAIDRPRGDLLYAVHGDRATGTVVLTFANCMGDSCTCDPLFTAEVMQWSPETFAALDAHPCADPESKDGLCHGVDYGF
jgi:hypothetical protein